MPTAKNRVAKTVLRFTAALMLLGFYLAPNTAINRWSPIARFPMFEYGSYRLGDRVFACAMALTGCAVYMIRRSETRPSHFLWSLLLIYVSLFCIGTLTMSGEAQVSCSFVLISLSSGLLAGRLCGSPSKIAMLLCGLGTVEAIYGLVGYFERDHLMVSGTVIRSGGTFYAPTTLSELMMVCLSLSIGLVTGTKRLFARMIFALAFAFMFAAMTLTWSRGPIIGLTCALVYLIYKVFQNKAAVFATIACLIVCVSFVSVVRSHGAVNRASADRSSAGRYILWREGWRCFTHNWTGVGLASLKLPVREQYLGRVTDNFVPDPKNLFIDWLDEMGVGGGILFLLFIFGVARALANDGSSDSIGFASCWLALFVAGLFDTPFGVVSRGPMNAVVGALLGATLLMQRRRVGLRQAAPAPI